LVINEQCEIEPGPVESTVRRLALAAAPHPGRWREDWESGSLGPLGRLELGALRKAAPMGHIFFLPVKEVEINLAWVKERKKTPQVFSDPWWNNLVHSPDVVSYAHQRQGITTLFDDAVDDVDNDNVAAST
jgi:hypothetical protein